MNGSQQNQLLARLNDAEYRLLAGHLEQVTLSRTALIAEPGAALEYAYFPTGCVLSSIIVLSDGASVEAATAGNEGMIYVGFAAGQHDTPYRILPQIAGECLRISSRSLQDAMHQAPRLRSLLHRYTLALLHQSSQNSACNLRHNIEERMARWLLVCADRSGRSELPLTQEFLSIMLGVRRQSVNMTAGLLQRSGLIAYRRGGIKIIDRPGLEATACECYRVSSEMYAHVMSMSDPYEDG